MMSLFSFVGRMLDKTTVTFGGKERFEELNKQFSKAMGAIGWIFLLLMLSLVSIGWVWYVGTHPTPARFYMVNPPQELISQGNFQLQAEQSKGHQGQSSEQSQKDVIHEMRTTLDPKMSNSRVQSWLTRSLMEVYTFDFLNYNEVFSNMRIVFRPDTYDAFYNQMNKRNGILDNVRSNSLVVSLTPVSTVRIVKQGNYEGKRIWMMEMKALVYFSGALAEMPPPKYVLFTVLVEEVSPTENPYGLVISQISERETN